MKLISSLTQARYDGRQTAMGTNVHLK